MIGLSQENTKPLGSLPQIDGDVMLWSVETKALVLSPEPPLESIAVNDPAIKPDPELDVPFSARFMLEMEPRVDENAFSQRLKVDGLDADSIGPWPLGLSLLWHGLLIAIVLGFTQAGEIRKQFRPNESEAIEVSFGMSLDLNRALPDGKAANEASDAEATKSAQQLPQLPKLLAIDAATPAPTDTSLASPESSAAKPSVTPEPSNQTADKAPPTPGPTVDQVDPAAAKKMKLDELAKRLEKEQRKVGEQEKAGNKKSATNDEYKRPSDIPVSPLGQDIPAAPKGLSQVGSITGKVSQKVKSAYAQAAALHMRKHWSLPEVLSFETRLEVVLGFDINTPGRILGRVKVVRGSGNARFDEEAKKALEAAGPFPGLPKEMGSRLSLRMKFSPQSINF